MDQSRLQAALSSLLYFSGTLINHSDSLSSNAAKKSVRAGDQLWIDNFKDNINPDFKQFLIDPFTGLDADGNASDNQRRIRIALQLSLPFDQAKLTVQHEPVHRLRSIFDAVSLNRETGRQSQKSYLPMKPLALDETHIFPNGDGAGSSDDLLVLTSKLAEEAQKSFDLPETYLENLGYLAY